MEALTRLVTESLARHGFDRPLDYRHLQWSRWFRCESHHSLLVVPSKPGVFALAEEVMDFATSGSREGHDFSRAIGRSLQTSASADGGLAAAAENSRVDHSANSEDKESKSASPRLGATALKGSFPNTSARHTVEERRFSAASDAQNVAALAAGATDAGKRDVQPTRMLAVTKFFEDDDMAFVLDRMLSQKNPIQARLASGRYFLRFVVIQDPAQRRSICGALNQWILSSAEKATGIGSHFATSLEFTPELSDTARSHRSNGSTGTNQKQSDETRPATAPRLNSAVDTTIHCSSSFPSGF